MFTRLICTAWMLATWSMTRAVEPAPLAGNTLDKGSMSDQLQDVPLATVVTDIATRSGIKLHMENAAALPRVTAHFTGLPFAEGLARLLKTAPGSLVVRNGKRGYGGVTGLYVIASLGQLGPPPTPVPAAATLEDIRRSIATLQAREVSPALRQAYDDALAPAPDEAVQSRSLRRAQNLDSLLREIGGATTQGKTPTDAASSVTRP